MFDSSVDTNDNSHYNLNSSSILGNELNYLDKKIFGESHEIGGVLITSDIVNLENYNYSNPVNKFSLELEITGEAVEEVQDYLTGLEADSALNTKLELAFGTSFNNEIADKLISNFAQDDFSDIPTIQIVDSEKINGANGGYDSLNGLIYLSREFVTAHQDDANTISGVILEEVGHFIDSRINAVDAVGDEGELFSVLVQGKTLSDSEIIAIKAENDIDIITIDGQKIEIEYSQDYTSRAKELWETKSTDFNERDLAKILQEEGATVEQIAQTLNTSLGFKLEVIADALDNGTTFDYSNIAKGLWNSGHQIDARKLADLLWDEGATEIEIGKALKYVGSDLFTIADALDDGITKNDGTRLNYNSVATGLWNSGHKIDTRKLADLLWDEGATQGEIAQALNYSIGRNPIQIASDMKYGVTLKDGKSFNYTDVAIGLWNSGHAIDTRKLADLLWDTGATQAEIGKGLKYLGFGLPTIADALDDGATGFNYTDVGLAVWHSGYGMSSYRLGKILRDEGASFNEAVGVLQRVTGVNYITAVAEVVSSGVKDWLNDASKSARNFTKIANSLYEDTKSILDIPEIKNTFVDTIENIGKDIEKVVTDDVIDILKRVPVVGTAVGAVEGIVNAIQGDEKGVLKSSIDSALAFYGASNVITPKMVDFVVDILWELKDSDYKGAISESLNNLGVNKTVSELFVSVAWAMEQGNWENAIDAALSTIGFDNAKEFVDIAWDVIDKNYKEALEAGLELVGLDSLNIDQAKADTFIKVVVAVKDGNYNQVADHLIALAGNDA